MTAALAATDELELHYLALPYLAPPELPAGYGEFNYYKIYVAYDELAMEPKIS